MRYIHDILWILLHVDNLLNSLLFFFKQTWAEFSSVGKINQYSLGWKLKTLNCATDDWGFAFACTRSESERAIHNLWSILMKLLLKFVIKWWMRIFYFLFLDWRLPLGDLRWHHWIVSNIWGNILDDVFGFGMILFTFAGFAGCVPVSLPPLLGMCLRAHADAPASWAYLGRKFDHMFN